MSLRLTSLKVVESGPAVKRTAPDHHFFDNLANSAYIRAADLAQSPGRAGAPALLPFSAPTLWRKVKNGSFPRPVKLSQRVTAWQVGSVRSWIAAQTLEVGEVQS